METYNKNLQPKENKIEKVDRSNGRLWAGLVIILVGAVWLAREAGVDIPRWLTSWPMTLIIVGILLGVQSSFKNWVWLFPFGIGLVFLLDRFFYFSIDIRDFIWPTIVIVVGLVLIFRRKSNSDGSPFNFELKTAQRPTGSGKLGEDDVLDVVSIFGSAKKNVVSKDFKGGEVVNFFGGTELNLHQADISGPVLLEMTQIFGGATLIVPSNWRIQSELVSIFGGIDDKRMVQSAVEPNKVLVLKGTSIFGGLEIKSY